MLAHKHNFEVRLHKYILGFFCFCDMREDDEKSKKNLGTRLCTSSHLRYFYIRFMQFELANSHLSMFTADLELRLFGKIQTIKLWKSLLMPAWPSFLIFRHFIGPDVDYSVTTSCWKAQLVRHSKRCLACLRINRNCTFSASHGWGLLASWCFG